MSAFDPNRALERIVSRQYYKDYIDEEVAEGRGDQLGLSGGRVPVGTGDRIIGSRGNFRGLP